MAASTLDFVPADEDLWSEYAALAERAYGHPVHDITRLGPHADRRVVLREGTVVAGGMGMLIPQWFGGRAVPSASMACGSVAPESRGEHLAARLTAERLRPLREQGAVLATLWTSATSYVRRLGWEAPTSVISWTIPTVELRRRSGEQEIEIQHGDLTRLDALRDTVAAQWNGPWQRPPWWLEWQRARYPNLTTYRFGRQGEDSTGTMSIMHEHRPGEDRTVVVQDFWASDHLTACAMLAFLGAHHSRVPTVVFERTSLPPGNVLSQFLRRCAVPTPRSHHPWMLRVLDPRRAVELRGWPTSVDLELPLNIASETGEETQHYTLRIGDSHGELTRGGPSSDRTSVALTHRHLAVWYAGGYRSRAAATLAGIAGDPAGITRLVAATHDREPWLADHF